MDKIKAVALDIDGVLTDGNFYWGSNGEELKKFSFSDVMGVSLGQKAGLIFALISGESNTLIDRFAEKMGIVDIYKGSKDKAAALCSFSQKYRWIRPAECRKCSRLWCRPARSLFSWRCRANSAGKFRQRSA